MIKLLSVTLALCFTTLLAPSVSAEPAGQDASCPSVIELENDLTLRKDKLEKLQWGLTQLVNGKVVTGIALNALFMIDITDDEAAAKRIEELQREIGSEQPLDPFLNCARSITNLHSIADQIWTLEQSVANLRLHILSLPPEKRSAILRPQIEASAQADTAKQLQLERKSAIQEQKEAAKSLERVEQAERAELGRIRSELAALQVKWVSDLEQQANFYQDISRKLTEFARSLLKPETLPAIQDEYQKAVLIWRTLVDKTGKVVSGRYALSLPNLPDYPQKLLDQIGDTPAAKAYAEAYAEAKDFRDGLRQKIESRLQESVDLHYRLLLQSGEIRSQLLNQLLDHHDTSPLTFSKDLLFDIRRELFIVPFICAP